MSRKIYIDFTHGANGVGKTKYHGGGDFVRFITKEILKLINVENRSEYIVILWPLGNKPETLEEEEIYKYSKLEIMPVSNIIEIKYEKDSILFLPLIDNIGLKIIKKIKLKNNSLSIYTVIHGFRLYDLKKYDKYDRFYYSGYKKIIFLVWLRRIIALLISVYNLKLYLPYSDKIFTVSNNSLQLLTKFCKPLYIKPFYRFVENVDLIENNIKPNYSINYSLFLSSNRYEKNFIRTLEAFCEYKKKYGGNLYLYVVGCNDDFINRIKKMKFIENKIIEDWVKFFGYVSTSELEYLYRNSGFLIYTSKSEGFGLIPLEALNYLKPTVASWASSIPEVLGFSAYYIDPYCKEAIVEGINYMSKKNNQEYYISNLKKIRTNIFERGRLETEFFCKEILHELE